MGQAKRRAAEIQKIKETEGLWRSGLSDAELIILRVAERVEERIVRARNFTGGCYHLAFFMTRYLANIGVDVRPVIGWVTDGRWEAVTSHGWIEYLGTKTDVSLCRTEYPKYQPEGPLIVLDHVVRAGNAVYTYYQDDDPFPKSALEKMRLLGGFETVLQHKSAEHQNMLSISTSNGKIDAYLAGAPRGTSYDSLAELIA